VGLLDLKEAVYGHRVEDLEPADARRAAEAIHRHGMVVHTLSSQLFGGDIEQGQSAFAEACGRGLDRLLAVADILRPKVVRLLAAQSSAWSGQGDAGAYVSREHPWLLDRYRQAIDRIRGAGFEPMIENEVGSTLFRTPGDIVAFFDRLDRQGAVQLIWDVQNLWQVGVFPSLAVYGQVEPLIGMLHLKGGQAETPNGPLAWKANLDEASWPVAGIVRAAIHAGVSPVMCINPSHGRARAGYDPDPQRDLAFLRQSFPEIE
jgi:hypothetical protein